MIHRAPWRKRYVTISKVGLEDTSLSWGARGIHAYLMSKPDNWQVSITHLVNQSPDGRHAVRSAIEELKLAGYLRVTRERGRGGKFGGWATEVYEEPMSENQPCPMSEKPSDGKSHSNELLIEMNDELMNNEAVSVKEHAERLRASLRAPR